MTLCDRGEGGGSAERYVTPKIFYMYIKYHIIICIIVYVHLYIIIFYSYMYYYKHVTYA